MQAIAELDREFFKTAEAAAEAVSTSKTDIEDVVEDLIQKLESTKNEYVDGVDRNMMVITATPQAHGMCHGREIYGNVRQEAALLIQVKGAVAQPVAVEQYDAERIPQSHDFSIDLFIYYGTKAVTPDLIYKIESVSATNEIVA